MSSTATRHKTISPPHSHDPAVPAMPLTSTCSPYRRGTSALYDAILLLLSEFRIRNDYLLLTRELHLDPAEAAFLKLIQADNVTAVIVALKTLGKHRGWIEYASATPPTVVPKVYITVSPDDWDQVEAEEPSSVAPVGKCRRRKKCRTHNTSCLAHWNKLND